MVINFLRCRNHYRRFRYATVGKSRYSAVAEANADYLEDVARFLGSDENGGVEI